ncbi:MAG: glucose 1-dehydrogenase [Chloroflexota bacterium]
MASSFKDRIGLVTGGASGIGRATALSLGEEGAVVVISDISPDTGQQTAQQIEDQGGQAQFIQTDVSQIDAVEQLISTIVDTYGRLDIAINNAGIGGRGANIADYSFEDWHQVMDINLNAVFYCMKFQSPQMVKQNGGLIVNTSSIAGLRGLANSSAYSASKHGVIGLTKTAALEYARNNIRVNAVCPVFTRTPLVEELFENRPDFEEKLVRNIPMRRYGQPEDIAKVIVWLCSDDSEFMTGQAIPIDGGLTAR